MTGIALVLLALFGSLHTASAYYDPGVQRWLNRDPLGDIQFQLRHRYPLASVSLLPSYVFIQNSPAGSIDPLGLDRWFFAGVHPYIVVAEWDPITQQEGSYKRIEFGPDIDTRRGYVGIPFFLCGGRIFITPTEKPDEGWQWGDYVGDYVTHTKSDCKADRVLLKVAREFQASLVYHIAFFNCWEFAVSIYDVGLTPPLPDLQPEPPGWQPPGSSFRW